MPASLVSVTVSVPVTEAAAAPRVSQQMAGFKRGLQIPAESDRLVRRESCLARDAIRPHAAL
jgi:hypothetical protein